MTAPPDTPILTALNPRQREAVEHTEGPLLILAGPGSGKTRVIAHRIAYLVRERASARAASSPSPSPTRPPARCATASSASLGEDLGRDITLGTFHAVCSRILRIDGEQIGVPRTFAIYDDSDQIAAVKRALDDLGLDPRRIAPRAVLSAISRAKSELQGPREFAAIVADYFQEVDLARLPALPGHPRAEQRPRLRRHPRQDRRALPASARTSSRSTPTATPTSTSTSSRTPTSPSTSSPSSWAAAPPQHLRRRRPRPVHLHLAQRRHPQHPQLRARLPRRHASCILDQNYRSTQTILDSAHSVIALNKQRKEKNLWTENGAGDPIVVHEAYDEEDEAPSSSRRSSACRRDERPRLSRHRRHVPHQRPVPRRSKKRFVRRGIPYRLVGGTRFYERREVKDLLAYLRLIQNPFDAVAMMRVINIRHRGIGDRTLAELNRLAREPRQSRPTPSSR